MTSTVATVQSLTRLRETFGLQNRSQWPDPELSIGAWYRKMGLKDCWEARGAALEIYSSLSKEIKRILEQRIEFLNEGEPVPKTVTFSLYMIGRKTANARPTVMFCCERPLPRRRARDLIKENGILDKHPSWALGDCSFPPELNQPLVRLALDDMKDGVDTPADVFDERVVLYRPNGKVWGIEVFLKGPGGTASLRRATVGGIVRAKERCYGLTVAHAFYETSLSPKPQGVDFQFDLEDSEEESDLLDGGFVEQTSKGSQTPDSETSGETMVSSRDSRTSETGTTAISVMPDHPEASLQTGVSSEETNAPLHPTLQSAMVLTEPNRDSLPRMGVTESNGPLMEFGSLAMSSQDSISISLDWALVEIRSTQLQAFTGAFVGLGSYGPGPRFQIPELVADGRPRNAAVVAVTGSGNILHGTLSGTPTHQYLPNTKTFQEVWSVTLNGKLTDGDCGTWVCDASTGMLYGHIVSGGPGFGVAYVIPAHQIYNDIRQRFAGIKVELCIGIPEENSQPRTITEPIRPLSRRAQNSETGPSYTSTRFCDIVETRIRQRKNTYKYRSFDYHNDIRILRIFHGKKSDGIECILFPSAVPSTSGGSSTSATHKYWALSYWWGEDDPRNPIKIYYNIAVQDAPQKKKYFNRYGMFYIRNNLDDSLRQLRSETQDVDIWVDALCIDQENTVEKAVQVSRMHEIYAGAENVCVWLGAGTGKTKETFDFLKKILDLQHLDQLIQDRANREKWMLVVSLMKNRWFSRRWVIQELALAKKASLRWGGEEIQWSNFEDAIALFVMKHDSIRDILGPSPDFSALQEKPAHIGGLDPRTLGAYTLVNATSNLFRKSNDGTIQQRLLTLEVLVSTLFLPFEASDPRDTIYAVLPLAKDISSGAADPIARPNWITSRRAVRLSENLLVDAALLFWSYLWAVFQLFLPSNKSPAPPQTPLPVDIRLSPDYEKSYTDVCTDFMEYCIERSGSLDILCRHWAPRPKEMTLLEKLKGGPIEEEKLPTWIPSLEGHAFGSPLGVLSGRNNGDGFVGSPERHNQQHYNASAGLRPYVRFGKYKTPRTRKAKNSKGEAEEISKIRVSAVRDGPEPSATPPVPKIRKFDGTLYVRGIQFNTVARISGRVFYGVIPKEALHMGGWSQRSKGGMYPDEVPDRLWRTLVANRGPHGFNAPSWYRRACAECLTHTNQNGDLNTDELKNLKGTPTSMVTFLDRVQHMTWNRTFFLSPGTGSKSQVFGLGPPGMREGDVICFLFGCSVPVILRESADKSGCYNFVGECYIHGMMDGEVIPMQQPEYPYAKSAEFKLQ